MSLLETLRGRGYVENVSDEAGLERTLGLGPISVYCGYDATAPSLHVGHLLPIMLLVHFQRAGHRPIAVAGGGTTLIGDPSGRSSAAVRPMLSSEEIEDNLVGIRAQLGRFLDFSDGKALLLNNADWLLPLQYLPFLRDVGRHFTLNQLMQHQTYRERFEQASLSFLELNYALVQAYDYLHLARTHDCVLQIGGNDQWFNILAGVELIRRVEEKQALALTVPLLTTASGQKMGKSEQGAVWLDPALTSPYDYYQFWRNVEDADTPRFLRLFTFLAPEEVAELESLTGAAVNRAKEILAFEATRIVHGEDEARQAQETARARFRGEGADLGPSLAVAQVASLVDLLAASGLADSRSDAKRLIRGGGVRLNDNPETADRMVALEELPALLAVGKRKIRLDR